MAFPPSTIKKLSGSTTTVYIGKLYECTNGVCMKHIFAGAERIASTTPSTTYVYHTDPLRSTVVVTDLSGSVVQEIRYYPFGEVRSNTGSVDLKYKYTGKEKDGETGLYYYGARYYDPVIGRFISADTIVQSAADPQTLNRYSYVRNNPLLYVDPDGHWFLIDDIVIGAILGAVIGGASAAITGGNIGTGLLTGAIGGAFFGAAGGIIEDSIASAAQSAGISFQAAAQAGMGISTAGQVGLHMAAGVTSGAVNAAITGSDVGLGMLVGGASGGIGKFTGGLMPKNFAAQFAARSLVGGVTGGITAEIYGGDFGDGFVSGATTAAVGTVANDFWHYWKRVQYNWKVTHEVLGDGPANWAKKLAILASSFLASGKLPASIVAQDTGLVTPLQAGKAILAGEGVANLSLGQTVASGGTTWAITALVVSGSFEVGVGFGSLFYPGAVQDLAR